jgi:outer membrane protein assembly factor BamA
VTPWDRLTVALMGRAGYLTPYGATDSVPDDQLFYLGGAFSVRGYDENMLYYDAGGNALGGRVSLMAAWNSGSTWERISSSTFSSIRAGSGSSRRTRSPVGPVVGRRRVAVHDACGPHRDSLRIQAEPAGRGGCGAVPSRRGIHV